jgi:putative Ca2+/H+ antiporter (TMEM165/GDT1 family)
MDLRLLGSVFLSIFVAELGDKTQLATFSFAAAGKSRLAVFLGAVAALTLASFLSVYFGDIIARAVPAQYIKLGAGGLFMVIGAWLIFS